MRYANVVSTLSLFIALGGVSYAATQLEDNSVRSNHVVNGSLTGGDIKNGTLLGSDVADGSLSPKDITGLPGRTYFQYRDKPTRLPHEKPEPALTVAKQSVPAGTYLVFGQLLAQPNTSAGGAKCGIFVTKDSEPGGGPLIAYGESSGGTTNLEMHGVTSGKIPATTIEMLCRATGPGDVDMSLSRLTVIGINDLAISSHNN